MEKYLGRGSRQAGFGEPALEEACEVLSRCVRREYEAKMRERVSWLYCDTI
jgi:hypothetical protein